MMMPATVTPDQVDVSQRLQMPTNVRSVLHRLNPSAVWATLGQTVERIRGVLSRIILVGLLLMMGLLTWLLRDTALDRPYRFTLGVLAAALAVLAAALWLRTVKHRWAKVVPIRWLQKRHVLIGSLTVPLTVCHMGGPHWPGSLWSWSLMVAFALLIVSGVMIWKCKELRPLAVFVQQTIKAIKDPKGAAAVLSQKQQDALKGSATIMDTQDGQFKVHRALTLAFLVLVAGHVYFHLYF